MKAEELMIGDWVKTVCPKEESYQRVKDIISSDYPYIITAGDEEKWFLVEVEPIPLTREILEKNGWHYDELAVEFYSSDAFTVYGHKAPFGVFDGRAINYVHQLQHALRFVGLDKEIVL